jgi:hypothetical protein
MIKLLKKWLIKNFVSNFVKKEPPPDESSRGWFLLAGAASLFTIQ